MLGAVAIALAAGAVLLALALLAEPEPEKVAERFGEAWERRDYQAMYSMLAPSSREDFDEEEFAEAYEDAAATATATSLAIDDASKDGEEVVLPLAVSTEVWGTVTGDVRLPVAGNKIEWSPHLVFPGLEEGEELDRRTRAPQRAPLLARNGTALAEGDADERSSELGLDASAVAGTVAPASTEDDRDGLYERGFPEDSRLGITGLERIFERELAGTPGGVLLAGDRELARSKPLPAEPVETTIAADLQEAAALALTRFGGIAAVDPQNGEVRALVGQAAVGPQPPGSTFKIVTTTAALEEGMVTPSTEFPVETAAIIDGVTLSNAHDEACGGTFAESFARSCNSVFAPLGVKVGAEKLVETAERYGINRPPAIPGTDTSTMPQPDDIESDLELGATAIGQGELLVTPLRLAAITQTIANDGKLVEPSLLPAAPAERSRVTSRKVAATIEDLMVGVVAVGTGENAAISGVDVAGKTGTAELGEDITEHAWFTGFAPAGKNPDVAVSVMIANGGAGGEVAAPVAKAVLEAGL